MRLGVSELQLQEVDDSPSDTASSSELGSLGEGWPGAVLASRLTPLGAFTGEGGGENTASPRPSFAAS